MATDVNSWTVANLGVKTVVMQDGVIVRAVPRQVKGRFVVSEPARPAK